MLNFALKAVKGPIETSVRKIANGNSENLNNFDGDQNNRTEILYADLNSLYPSFMLSNLAYSGYRWMTKSQLNNIDFVKKPNRENMLLEVDLEYDKSLHDRDNDLPLAPSKRSLDNERVSNDNIIYVHHKANHLNEMLSLDLHDKQLCDHIRQPSILCK
jgi:hypothetical protein